MSDTLQSEVINLIQKLLPQILIAGRYAAQIQKSIAVHPAKNGMASQFSQALTDADLSVQNFIEVCLLSSFSQYAFFGEEYASSLNCKHFPASSNLTVLLDPIDGTLFYKDGAPTFSVIMGIVSPEKFQASIIFFPCLEKCYLAIAGEGTFVLTLEEMSKSCWSKQVVLNAETNRLVALHQPELAAKISPKYNVVDIHRDYQKGVYCPTFETILDGTSSAMFVSPAQFIDGMAFAFAIEQAGGYLCDLQGQPLSRIDQTKNWIYPSALAASSQKLAEEILSEMRKQKTRQTSVSVDICRASKAPLKVKLLARHNFFVALTNYDGEFAVAYRFFSD